MKDHPVFSLVLDEQSIHQLALELADDYVDYFDIDIGREQEAYQDAIEECLAHFEEVSSTLEDLTRNSVTIDAFADIIDSKNGDLGKLYAQVDAIDQYILETNRSLDEMDVNLAELERHQRSKASRIKQFIGRIPGISTMPRLSLFSSFIPETISGTSENMTEQNQQQQLIPIEELLSKIHQVEMTLSTLGTKLNQRLHGNIEMTVLKPKVDESMATLSLNEEGNVDGSWQELL